MSIHINDVLGKTNNGLDIFKYYLGSNIIPNKQFKSPFYNDSKASCSIYLDKKSNRYKYKDFGENISAVDCFGFVGRLKNIDLNDKTAFFSILQLIDNELSLNLNNGNTITKSTYKKAVINYSPESSRGTSHRMNSIKFQEFTKVEIEYWNRYGINLITLKAYNVRSVESFNGVSASKKNYTIKSSGNQPIFAYCFSNYTKLYRPFSKLRFLFIGNKENEYVFGRSQLPLQGDVIFITGGEKDVLSLSARGFNSICFNSETANVSSDIIFELKKRFKHIVVLYDCDKTGIESMNSILSRYKDLNLIKILLPLSGKKNDKDISDYFKKGYSNEQFMQLFKAELSKKYLETINTLKTCEIDLNIPPIVLPPLLKINDASIGSPGNIIGITGTEGSGKSNFVAAVISGCLNPLKLDIDTLGVSIEDNTKSKAVLIYDTEQSIVQLHNNVNRVKQRADLNELPNWFKAFSLVSLNRNERLKAIIESIDNYYYEFNGIHLIVIDGIADLIGSVNDEEQSVDLVNTLFQIAGRYNTLLICVLHLNPGGIKLRGHLGSELQRKASGILSVEKRKDQSVSTVKALKLREADPLSLPIIQFAWQETIQQHSFIGYLNSNEQINSKINKLKEFAERIFSANSIIQSTELGEYLMNHFDIKERMARNYIKLMRENLIIKKEHSHQNAYILSNID